MQSLVALIASIVSGEASDAVARARRAALIYALAGLALFAGIIFLLVAGYIALAREIGALPAALWFGGGFVALAILIVVIHRIGSTIRARRIARRRQSEVQTMASAAALALLPTLLASRAGGIALLTPVLAAVGYAVYRENRRRDVGDDPHR